MAKRQQTIATIVALLIVIEIALHFCWKVLDAWLFANFTVTTQIAILAVILLLALLYFQESLFLSSLGGGGNVSVFRRAGRGLKSRYGHHYAGLAKAGRFGVVEAGTFIAWVVTSLACFGVISLPDVTYKTLAITVVALSDVILLAQKAQIKFTALEMVCFAISVLLPIMATGVINGFTLPADWLATTWNRLELWGVSAVATVVMAYQD